MLWLLACIDFQVASEPAAPEAGDLVVAPEAVAIEGVCGTESSDVVLQNRGGSALTLFEVAVAGEGWTVREPSMPATIAPGQAVNVEVEGSAGLATLTLTTDDKDTPIVTVPLSATANLPPVVYITAPYEGQVLDPEVAFTLAAVVSDPESPSEALTAEWRSNRLGHLLLDAPGADGKVETEWPDELRVPGPVVLELLLTDPCGAIGENSMFACQNGAWTVQALAADVWRTLGDAQVDQTAATATLGPGVGGAFDAYLTFDADLFEAEFAVTGSGAGFAFVLLDPARADGWLGADGCGLGVGAAACEGPGLPGWAVVVDTEAGDGNDCGEVPTIALVVDGDFGTPLACASLPAPFGGGTLRLSAEAGAVHAELDGALVLDAALPEGVGGTAYAGFTGVGGWLFEELTLTDSRCDPP